MVVNPLLKGRMARVVPLIESSSCTTQQMVEPHFLSSLVPGNPSCRTLSIKGIHEVKTKCCDIKPTVCHFPHLQVHIQKLGHSVKRSHSEHSSVGWSALMWGIAVDLEDQLAPNG